MLYEGPALTVNFPLVRALRSGLKSNSKVFIATQRPRVEAMEESIFLLVGLAEMYVTSVIIVTFMKFVFLRIPTVIASACALKLVAMWSHLLKDFSSCESHRQKAPVHASDLSGSALF